MYATEQNSSNRQAESTEERKIRAIYLQQLAAIKNGNLAG